MPQILAVFVTAFWLGLAVFGIVEWYWALAGWFICGPAYVAVKRMTVPGNDRT